MVAILKKKKEKIERGFVLIEMMVSVALFSVVMTVGLGSLLGMIASNKKSQSLKVVVNNINLVMESMSKDLRMGHSYNCGSSSGGDCNTGKSSIYFVSKEGNDVRYSLEAGSIKKVVDTGVPFSVTSPDVTIDYLKFYVLGSINGDNSQPRVVIVIKGHKGNRVKDRLTFSLQTVVTQRILDF